MESLPCRKQYMLTDQEMLSKNNFSGACLYLKENKQKFEQEMSAHSLKFLFSFGHNVKSFYERNAFLITV